MAITLRETETEYLLYIGKAQKERAKGIWGRRWDSERRCWVYPHNRQTYREIVSEFGDELTDLTKRGSGGNAVTIMAQAVCDASASIGYFEAPRSTYYDRDAEVHGEQEDSDELRTELEEARSQNTLKTTLLALARARISELEGNVARLQAEVKAQSDAKPRQDQSAAILESQQEIAALRTQVASSQEELTRRDSEVEALNRQNADLQNQLAVVAAKNANDEQTSQTAQETAQEYLKQVIANAAGTDCPILNWLSDFSISDRLTIQVAQGIQGELRRLTNTPDTKISMYDLLQLAREKRLLSSRGLSLAHLFRMNRNSLIHPDAPGGEEATIILCLVAAGLLWPELSGTPSIA